jgi:hypothetical protein
MTEIFQYKETLIADYAAKNKFQSPLYVIQIPN